MTESIRKPNTNCLVCGSPVYRRPSVLIVSNGAAYCGSTCYGKSCQKEIACIICGTRMLSGANKKTCSRACANKNRSGIHYTGRRLKDKAHSIRVIKKRIMQLRGEQCERCDFAIRQVLVIHHQDRNHFNNSVENLELLCPNCHAKEHYLKN